MLEKSQNIDPRISGPKFGRPNFVSQNSAPTSGSGGAKSPVQKFVPSFFADHLCNDFHVVWNVMKFMQGPHVATKRPY